jgi:hypothetical protein
MADIRSRIKEAALVEWKRWGQGKWDLIRGNKSRPYDQEKRPDGHHTDDEPEYATIVREQYCQFVISDKNDLPSLNAISGDSYAWSAVAVSYIMGRAGFTKSQFRFAQSHSRYIRNAVAARNANDANAAYWGYRIHETEAAPEVGDLVGYARGETGPTFDAAQKFYDKTSSYMSHTDVVVAKRPGEIDVIGGNVKDTILKKTLPLSVNGLLADRTLPWFVVMKLRA